MERILPKVTFFWDEKAQKNDISEQKADSEPSGRIDKMTVTNDRTIPA